MLNTFYHFQKYNLLDFLIICGKMIFWLFLILDHTQHCQAYFCVCSLSAVLARDKTGLPACKAGVLTYVLSLWSRLTSFKYIKLFRIPSSLKWMSLASLLFFWVFGNGGGWCSGVTLALQLEVTPSRTQGWTLNLCHSRIKQVSSPLCYDSGPFIIRVKKDSLYKTI